MIELFTLGVATGAAAWAESVNWAPHRIVILWMLVYSFGRWAL